MTDKDEIRRRGLLARRSMDADARASASAEIVRRVAASEVFRRARTVLIYAAMPDEVDLSGIEDCPEAAGKRICYPRILKERQMEALIPCSGDSWRQGTFGIMEPDPGMSEKIDPHDIDLVICPCTAFDAEGRRMGMGGGYYDRYLPGCRNAVIAAAAFEVQRVAHVPEESYDVRMQMVFTEKNSQLPATKKS